MGKNERGQVGVVVAILMVSLFVAVIVLVQVYYVPNWMRDREATHMDTVANQFSQIKASIDIEAMAQRDMSLINSITLGSKELPFFVSARAFGSLNVLSTANSDFAVGISGSGLPATSMSRDVTANQTIQHVRSLSSFDLQLDMANMSDGERFNATAGGATLSVLVTGTNGYWQIDLTVSNASEPAVYDQSIAWIPQGVTAGTYSVNLLSDDYKFSTHVLPYISSPYNMSFTFDPSTAAGTFAVSGSRYAGDMTGIMQPDSMGTIEYTSENAYFVDQTYVYEGGAVVLSQSAGQAVISAPGITASNVTGPNGARHVYDLTVVDVAGAAGKNSVSGYGTYSIKTNYSSTRADAAIASNLTVTINTNYPAAWARYMEGMLNRSGITNFEVEGNQSESRVTVTLHGPQTNGSYDIKLTVRKINIRAQVGPGWIS